MGKAVLQEAAVAPLDQGPRKVVSVVARAPKVAKALAVNGPQKEESAGDVVPREEKAVQKDKLRKAENVVSVVPQVESGRVKAESVVDLVPREWQLAKVANAKADVGGRSTPTIMTTMSR